MEKNYHEMLGIGEICATTGSDATNRSGALDGGGFDAGDGRARMNGRRAPRRVFVEDAR
jgi:hypothetical protein